MVTKRKEDGTLLVQPPTYPIEWVDGRGVQYVTNNFEYLTTGQLATELEMYPETLFRWCRKWFGVLPSGRAGARMGYRIPVEYRMVARGWLQTEDPRLREVMRRAIVETPRNWVVVVDNVGSTHYSGAEVVGRVDSLLSTSAFRHSVVSILYVGSTDDVSG